MSPTIDEGEGSSGGRGRGVRWRLQTTAAAAATPLDPAEKKKVRIPRGIRRRGRRRGEGENERDDGGNDDDGDDPASEDDDDDDLMDRGSESQEEDYGGQHRGGNGNPKGRRGLLSGRPGGGISKDDSDPALLSERKRQVLAGVGAVVFRRGAKRDPRGQEAAAQEQSPARPRAGSADSSVLSADEEHKSMNSSGRSSGGGGPGARPKTGLLGKLRRRGGRRRSGDHRGGGGADGVSSVAGSVDHSVDRGYASDDGSPTRAVSFDFSGMSSDSRHPSGHRRGSGSGGGLDRYSDHVRTLSFDSNTPSTHRPGERARYSVHHGRSGNKRKMRVKPHHAFPDAVYMTEEDIYADSLSPTRTFDVLRSYLKPSSKFALRYPVPESVSAAWGSPHDDGRIGALRLEVLGCVSLARQKPDVVAYAVCGDAAFATDVLAGYRSPMWPSGSRRGAVFPLMHGYAKLFVGVFDVKARKNKDNDVFCGRVVLDVATMRPDTEYDVTFPLRASSFVYDRKARGVVRLRFGLHWFNERAPVWSYWKRPKSLALSSPCHGGLPTIPCADPKTFRNVAVTVYGQDFPGKYTKSAFRATMREFNLYQQNARQMVKILVLNAVMYEDPWLSLYLFLAGMHCVWLSSIRLLPPYAVGYVLILFLQNHQRYVAETKYNLGYRPLTLWEVARGFFFHFRPDAPSFDTILLQKRTKKRKVKGKPPAVQRGKRNNSVESGNSASANEGDPDKEVEIEPLDHREFPFSDRDAYPKFAVEDALAASKAKGSRRASTTRLHGRLSVYYGPTESELPEPADKPEFEDDSDEDSDDDRDDESIVSEGGMGDMIYDMDMNDDFDELEMDITPKEKAAEATTSFQPGAASSKHRIRVGPPQNTDSRSSKKIPPQVHLQKVERILHKLTRSVALEIMHPPPDLAQAADARDSASTKDAGAGAADAQVAAPKRKKAQLDEFDRMLGLHSESRNPITRITATFLGPLMRMFRVFIYLFRIAFNISTWRDPYLSFWVCLALVAWCVILIWFPWRAFFLVVTVATVGPQNMFLRYYLEKKAEKKRRKEQEEAEKKLADQAASTEDYGYGVAEPQLAAEAKEREDKEPAAKSPEPPIQSGNSFFSRVFAKRAAAAEKADDDDDDVKVDRPPFRTDPNDKGSLSRKGPARSVVVPYTRFKPDRFFDWPPDPTVSRATPLRQRAPAAESGDHGYDDTSRLPPLWAAPADQASVDESYGAPGSEEDEGAYGLPADDDYDFGGEDSPVPDYAIEGSEPPAPTTDVRGDGGGGSGLRRRHVPSSAATADGVPNVHRQTYDEFEEDVGDYEYQEFFE